MNIEELDKNFELPNVDEENVCWRNARFAPFSLHGVFYDEENGCYRRVPKHLAQKIGVNTAQLSEHTAGGRVRFLTDSPYVAVKCLEPRTGIAWHMTVLNEFGCSLYADNEFCGVFGPGNIGAIVNGEGDFAFLGIKKFQERKKRKIDLYFPMYNGVKELFIGVQNGCLLNIPPEYEKDRRVVFYGSSITQGGCSSRPGNDYVSLLGRWLDCDITNLGFSGNAKGELEMAEYIAELDPNVCVMDYDHNADNAEMLEATHYPFYERLRRLRPSMKIVMMSMPYDVRETQMKERRDIIKASYFKAKQNGDENVEFIDGYTLFGEFNKDACTVDGVHPNDYGFYRMAKTVYPILKKVLNNDKKEN